MQIHTCKHTHTPPTFHLQEQEWLSSHKHVWGNIFPLGTKPLTHTGILGCMCVYYKRKSGVLQRKTTNQHALQPFLFPFTSVWNPGIAQSDRDKRWERERETKGGPSDRQSRECERWPCKVSCSTACTTPHKQWTWNELLGVWFLKSLLTWTLALCCIALQWNKGRLHHKMHCETCNYTQFLWGKACIVCICILSIYTIAVLSLNVLYMMN